MKYMISVMSSDRVGIIANVTGTLQKMGGNLQELSQSVLRGYFTMILLVDFGENTQAVPQEIQAKLHAVKELSDCCFSVLPYAERQKAEIQQQESAGSYVITASGPDRPGLVAAISAYFCEKKINIIDLSTRTDNQGNYAMMYLVNLPKGGDIASIKTGLEKTMAPYDLTIGLRNQALFHMVNEI